MKIRLSGIPSISTFGIGGAIITKIPKFKVDNIEDYAIDLPAPSGPIDTRLTPFPKKEPVFQTPYQSKFVKTTPLTVSVPVIKARVRKPMMVKAFEDDPKSEAEKKKDAKDFWSLMPLGALGFVSLIL